MIKGGAAKTVDEYFEGLSSTQRTVLQEIRETVRAAAPDAVELISYQMPAFKLQGKALIYYAAFKNHYSLFPTASVLGGFEDELKGFSTSKGTVQFTDDKPIPLDLVRRIAEAKAAQIMAPDSKTSK